MLKNSKLKLFLPIIYFIFIFFLLGLTVDKNKREKVTNSQLDTALLKFNRIIFPFNEAGVIGDVQMYGVRYDTIDIVFSGGFLLGGKLWTGTNKEKLWVSGVFTTRRMKDFQPGLIGMSPNDPKAKIYVVTSSDKPFSNSWIEWKTAVELGADFYDGDNDGVYNPIDKNNNGQWDLNEDRPNMIGDYTAWCVFNDGVPLRERRLDIEPIGVEVQQTIWAFFNNPWLANSVFVRYRINFKGNEQTMDLNKIDSVIFSFINDLDIGEYTDDLVGSDTLLNSVFGYNDGSDTYFSINPPAVYTQLLQGPQVSIPGVTFIDNNNNGIFDTGDVPKTNAKIFVDPKIVKTIPGKMNLGLLSTNYFLWPYQSELFNQYAIWYLLNGLNRDGRPYRPCTLGVVLGGVNCNQVNPKFIFSGDPVSRIGWINNDPHDIVLLLNSGHFTLEKNKPVDIIVAYAIGRRTNHLNSITEAKKNANSNKTFFDFDFYSIKPFPVTELNSRVTENSIDIFWETKDDFEYKEFLKTAQGDTFCNYEFELYELWAHRTPEAYYGKDTTISKKIATFDVENDINNLYYIDVDGITVKNLFLKGIQLNKDKYKNPSFGHIIYSLNKNPFTGKNLVKGEKLFFSLRKLYLNKISSLIERVKDKPGNYVLNFLNDFSAKYHSSKIYEVTVGESFNFPPLINFAGKPGSKNSTEAKVIFDEIDVDKLTDDLYQISFFKTDSVRYSLNWRLKNLSKNRIVLDSQSIFYNRDSSIFLVDGFHPKVEWIEPQIKDIIYSPPSNKWYKNFTYEYTGVFYPGMETINNKYGNRISALTPQMNARSRITTFDKLRKVEIRFGQKQFAYRFVSDGFGLNYYNAAQTVNVSGVEKPGEYFIEVPFQVWIKDERFKEERQLACGFLEARTNLGGYPDGNWTPGTNITNTKEYIVIFNQSYDPQGKQPEYIGYITSTTKVYANLRGWTPPPEANFTPEQIQRAKSPWFDALFIVGLEKQSDTSFFKNGDVLTIPISYVLTENDTFYYQSKSVRNKLSSKEKSELINSINVFPNPYFDWKDLRPYNRGYITFSNLPEEVTIKIYSLSGILVKTLTENDKESFASPFLNWNLRNEDG
ncbi:MAG: hypothetical protein N3F03_05435, partial [Ignavibacteria bacterium]|nr:hypothetical protein [Ignavibacteria bacterium]